MKKRKIINMNYIKKNYIKILELLLALVITVGSFTVFAACPVSEEHSMNCHSAQLAVTLLGTVFSLQALASLIIRNEKVRLGIAISQIPLIIALFFIPGTIFSLCMMSSMRCNSIFKPAVRVLSGLAFIVSVADVVISVIKKENGELQSEHKETAA